MNSKFFRTFSAMAAVLLLAACTQDEPADGNTLPDGTYPLKITSVTMSAEVIDEPWDTSHALQTRMAESEDGMSSKWDGGEVIQVTVSGTGNDMQTTCTLDASGNITAYNPQLYWQNTNDATINAWYSNIKGEATVTENTVSLSDQSGGLAYVLKVEPLTANYKTQLENMKLAFTHQLAKIWVVLTGDKAAEVNSVSIESCTSCTVGQGTVSNGATPGEIKMHYDAGNKTFEANVVPGQQITKFKVNGGAWVTLSTPVTPVAAKIHKITLTVGKLIIDVSEITDTEYEIKGNVHLKGNGQAKDLKLIVTDGSELTLENVNISPETESDHAITCQSDASITLKGNNTLLGKNGDNKGCCAIFVKSGTSTIKGDDNTKLTATGVGLYDGAGIGPFNGANIVIEGGNIIATGGT